MTTLADTLVPDELWAIVAPLWPPAPCPVLASLRERGLDSTRPLLVVIDVATALRRAVTDVFDHPVIQRCQLHKLRNVTDRVPDALASVVAKRMRATYRNPDPLIAQAELEALARGLDRSHPGAAAWPEVLARIDAEQGQRPGLEVAVYPCAPLQVLQPAGSPATLAPAT